MPDKFKKFIDTSGKSREEIKSSIERLLRKTVTNAVDDAVKAAQESVRQKIAEVVEDARRSAAEASSKRHASEKIPPRERDNVQYRSQPQKPSQLSPDEIAFAPDVPAYDRPEDEAMNEKIAKMRSLNEIFYNGYLVQQCAEISIVRQGEFMADVTDDFGRSAFCGISRPIYGALSNAQLRTYFTWRTDVRRGVYRETDKPYIMLYCYELMNKIGVMSSADAFGRLLALWSGCREFAGWLDGVMPRWLKDFYAYNDITEQYPDIRDCLLTESGFGGVISELYGKNYANKLEYLIKNSSYNLVGSIFYNKETEKLLDGAAEAVLKALDEYFDKKDISLFEIICGRLKKDYSWTPFSGAYVNLDRMEGFCAVRISPVERYCIKRGEPALEYFEAAPYRGFIGYVLKCTESELRRRTGFRHNITPNLNIVLNDFKNREKLVNAVSEQEFTDVIINAVNAWCDSNGVYPPKKERVKAAKPSSNGQTAQEAPREPVKVVIDVDKLSKIREESDEIAKRLIIEESLDAPSAEEIADIAEQISDDDFSDKISDYADISEQSEQNVSSNNCDFSALPDGWRELAQSLSKESLEVLAALRHGNAEGYCRENGLLPETVYEIINTSALDFVGDVVIENGEIIPDYAEDIEKIVAAAGF